MKTNSFTNLSRRYTMRVLLSLVGLMFCFGVTLQANEKEALKQKIATAKEQVSSGVAVIKGAKEQAKTIKDAVKAGTTTKEEAKQSLAQLRETARTGKEQVKAGKTAIRDARGQLRELKKTKP